MCADCVFHLVRKTTVKMKRKIEVVEELKVDNKSYCKAANNIGSNI